MEDGVSLQQPGRAFQTARRGGEIEAVRGVADHPQRQRGCPRWIQAVDLKLTAKEKQVTLKMSLFSTAQRDHFSSSARL